MALTCEWQIISPSLWTVLGHARYASVKGRDLWDRLATSGSVQERSSKIHILLLASRLAQIPEVLRANDRLRPSSCLASTLQK
jgi:hypothetical protein